MKYMITFSLEKGTCKETMARFLDNGAHRQPVSQCSAAGTASVAVIILAETDDPQRVLQVARRFEDLLDFTVVPVLEDEGAEPILRELKLKCFLLQTHGP